MSRRRPQEEHVNHEGWAIPYGDLVTLLLAFFVVMYAISSVNEGKYRVVADSMAEAFGGAPKAGAALTVTQALEAVPQPNALAMVAFESDADVGDVRRHQAANGSPIGPLAQLVQLQRAAQAQRESERLRQIAREIETEMAELIDRSEVTVRRTDLWIEIEIKSDMLFGSASAEIAPGALATLARVAGVLAPFPNPIEVEGHTDDLPIASALYPSNWELSAARAASVVKLLIGRGIEARRLSVIGYGAERPKVLNAGPGERARNRRVVLAVTALPLPSAASDTGTTAAATPAAARVPGQG